MDAHYGPLERFLADPRIMDSEEQPGVCLNSLFPQCWNSAVRELGPTRCSEFKNTSIRIREIAMRRRSDPPSAADCSKCMSLSAARIGNGSRTFWLMEMPDYPKPCCW